MAKQNSPFLTFILNLDKYTSRIKLLKRIEKTIEHIKLPNSAVTKLEDDWNLSKFAGYMDFGDDHHNTMDKMKKF